MNKRIVIKIGPGSLESGYSAAAQIGEEGCIPQVEIQAQLPPAPELPTLYQQWRESYHQLDQAYRIKAVSGVTNVSAIANIETCRTLSRRLRDYVHHWLNSNDFRPIREKLLEQLNPSDITRILLQTKDPLLQRIPWYELNFFQRYRQAEVGICAIDYQQVNYPGTRSGTVRILAVLGNATGLNTQIDQALLNQLPGADVHVLKEPSREAFNQALWDEQGWDILFFAGHSSSNNPCFKTESSPGSTPNTLQDEQKTFTQTSQKQDRGQGNIMLNATDPLTIPQLKHALTKAIDRGLNTAIFNSCDGLGLAADLAELHIPQVLVMREPVPDPVAHAFLRGFLKSFSAGVPFYLAVREAREKLQGLEARYPCATWLPVIVQNLAETPPTWHSLQGKSKPVATQSTALLRPQQQPAQTPALPAYALLRAFSWRASLISTAIISTLLLLPRWLGLLMPLELAAYDVLLRQRAFEPLDDQLLIVTNTTEDIANYPFSEDEPSLSNETLLKVLNKLEPLEPEVIGLDIYHNQPEPLPALEQKIKSADNLFFICKAEDPTTNTPAINPPPALADSTRVGYSDFFGDGSRYVLRRQLLGFSGNPPCNPEFTFSAAIAQRYLTASGGLAFDGDNLGEMPLPTINSPSFGSYAGLESAPQIMLNYRIVKDAIDKTGCGDVVEAPARCITVTDLLAKSDSELRGLVENRIVLIGTTAPEVIDTPLIEDSDLWYTPYTAISPKQQTAPGLFLQAQMVSQLINAVGEENRLLLTSWPEWKEIIWIVGWGFLGGCIGKTLGLKNLCLRLLLAEGLLLLACWLWLTRAGLWIPWVPSAIALPATAVLHKSNVKKRSTPPRLKHS